MKMNKLSDRRYPLNRSLVGKTISASNSLPAIRTEDASRVVVILSPYFPPSTLAGVHRARHLAKHLQAWDWTPVIVCVDEAHHEERLDPALVTLLPAGIEVAKAGAAPAWLTRRIGVGDIGLRAWAHLKRTLFTVLEGRPVGVVLITGAPFYPMLLSSEVKKNFRVPIVLDFQDPWVSSRGALQPAFSKAGISHRLATQLEPLALRSADYITSVSDTQNAEMAARYPWLNSSHMAAVPIGCDPDDFLALSANSHGATRNYLDADCINLSYVGTFLPHAGPLVRLLFRAIGRLRATESALAARIRLNFFGTSNQPNDYTTLRVRSLAEAEGVGELVREVPQRIPYLHALSVLTRSDGLLLIGSDEPHYTASKIYPALMSGRPFVSLFYRTSSANQILNAAGGGFAFSFTSLEELAALEEPLACALYKLAACPEAIGRVNSASYAPYEARAIAGRFADIFDSLTVR
jgi:Glycosyl transferase 4-like domain